MTTQAQYNAAAIRDIQRTKMINEARKQDLVLEFIPNLIYLHSADHRWYACINSDGEVEYCICNNIALDVILTSHSLDDFLRLVMQARAFFDAHHEILLGLLHQKQ